MHYGSVKYFTLLQTLKSNQEIDNNFSRKKTMEITFAVAIVISS